MQKIFKISQQTFWQILGKIVSSTSSFFVLAVVARRYGEEGTGVFTLSLTYLSLFFMLIDLGLNAYYLPRLTKKKEANNLFNFRLYFSIFLIVVAIFLAYILPIGNEQFRTSVLIGSLALVMVAIYNSVNLIFQQKLRYDKSAIASSLGSVLMIPVVWFLASVHTPVEHIILSLSFGWFIIALVALLLVRKFYIFKLTLPSLNYISSTFKKAWPISATLILNIVYFRVDTFILSVFKSFSEVGLYNVAFQFFQMPLVLPIFIMNSYYPLILRELRQKKNLLMQLKYGLLIMVLIGVLASFFTFALAPSLIRLLTGQGFEGSEVSLRILSLGLPAFFGSSLLMTVLVSLKKYQELFIVYGLGLVINFSLNLAFIPLYSYISSSWITGISEYLILAMLVIILSRSLKAK